MALMNPLGWYRASRCHSMWGLWVLDNTLLIGPLGWTVEHVSTGQYRITPDKTDFPGDIRRAIPIATLSWSDSASKEEVLPQPDSRTIGIVLTGDHYDVYLRDNMNVPVDGSFAFLVLSPH